MKPYKYQMFGFHVLSEFDLELNEVDFEDVDITIRKRTVDFEKNSPDSQAFCLKVTTDAVAFHASGIGTYLIETGKTITIDPVEGVTSADIKLYLLGSAFGFLMHQRKIYPLHGSTVVLNDGCVSLVGHSGAGKSSLGAGFVAMGYRLLTDDVSRLLPDASGFRVCHSYPAQKIWKDAAAHLDIPYDSTKQISTEFEKYSISFNENFETTPRTLKAVIEIFPSDVESPYLEALNRKDALDTLLTHSYRQEVMGPYMDLGAHLRFCAQVAQSVPVYRLFRPNNQFTVKEQVQAVLTQLG